MTWYRQIPKVELHVHLEGAIPHQALFDLIQKYGGDASVPDRAALERRFKYRDFTQFVEAWAWKNRFLREYEDFSHIAELMARDMASQNICYAEVFFSPSAFSRLGLEVQEMTRAVRIGLSRVTGIEIALIADLVRDYGPEQELITLRKLEEVRDQGVIGIGVGGSEHRFPLGPFRELFEQARRMGFHTTAHAGEAAGPESIWAAINDLRVERIGHATSACEDPKLLDYLAEHAIPLELCPGSNVRTGAVASFSDHPIRTFFQHGLIISVNTDDPSMFGTALAEEYRSLEQECGFTRAEMCQLILLTIQSSWLPVRRKETLAKRFTADPAWVNPM
ncbi:adenosine deaminase [bacterium]|nr:adenosine deaminase [bacterium]